jgi:hypothetical protein
MRTIVTTPTIVVKPDNLLRATRAAIALAGAAAWFLTQSLLASRGFPDGIGDTIQLWLAPATQWLGWHNGAADILLLVSSAIIDALACFLLASGVFGRTVRPLLGLMLLFILRQIGQALVALPPPDGMIWRYPGFPSLFVTYGTANDFFFSGHTAIAVLGAIELARLERRWLTVAAIAIAGLEALAVLALRAHYTMDVFAGVLAAAWVSSLVTRCAPSCDRALTRWLSLRPFRLITMSRAKGVSNVRWKLQRHS